MSRYTDAQMAAIKAARLELNPRADDDKNDGGHVEYVCTKGHSDGRGCQFCDGGLFMCTRCGSFEGATTTDCPREQMPADRADAVYAGTADYRDGAWVDGPSLHTPALWALACERAGVRR